MGLPWAELLKHPCLPNGRLRFDNCPTIWSDFSRQGYATAYAEDGPPDGVCLHYLTEGFCKEPTDYYMRPYYTASDELIGHVAGGLSYAPKRCQGGRMSMSVTHNYSLAIAQELKDIPYFGFYWSSSTTHDHLEGASIADGLSLDYLRRLKNGGHLDRTILIFISDHGMRFGNFRETFPGMLEERLPYAMMVFPKGFSEMYPEAMRHLRVNEGRLTSPFDLHATFHDILNRGYTSTNNIPSYSTRGQSLFQEVPKTRSCVDAGIPEHSCSCGPYLEVKSNDPLLLEAPLEAVQYINKGLLQFPQCVQMEFDKVLHGWKRTSGYESSATVYVVTFITQPGSAELEATVSYIDGKFNLTFEPSRINVYGGQFLCVRDRVFRKFYFCGDSLQS